MKKVCVEIVQFDKDSCFLFNFQIHFNISSKSGVFYNIFNSLISNEVRQIHKVVTICQMIFFLLWRKLRRKLTGFLHFSFYYESENNKHELYWLKKEWLICIHKVWNMIWMLQCHERPFNLLLISVMNYSQLFHSAKFLLSCFWEVYFENYQTISSGQIIKLSLSVLGKG